MSTSELAPAPQLLDTPKRVNLQSQSTQLRAALKDFERTFAANNEGRKPSKDDIKADDLIAGQYRQYNRVRDVLSGKLEYSSFISPPKSPARKRRHNRNESSPDWVSSRRNYEATPQKQSRTAQIEFYGTVQSASPKPVLLHAIGPTPQRDGRVLGLFDLLSNSAQSSHPSSSSRKRKLDTLIEDSPSKLDHNIAAQTPSRKKSCNNGDLLEYLTGTPETGHRKKSRTPVSEGRKFMLSQFFATPSAARYSDIDTQQSKHLTPIRDRVLGLTPQHDGPAPQKDLDTTPAYLRRSTSFKDRLLSASKTTASSATFLSPPPTRTGPPTLRHLRSAPKMLSQLMANVFEQEEKKSSDDDYDNGNDDEHEDDLEALNEIDQDWDGVLVHDSQSHGPQEASGRVWKKKGQKRTTRRAVMRPTQGKIARGPKFVAAEDESENEGGDGISQVEETQLYQGFANDSDGENYALNLGISEDDHTVKPSKKGASRSEKHPPKETKGKNNKRTINPNAVSHMNFRSLKIKNKNSKANGRGKFGSRRR